MPTLGRRAVREIPSVGRALCGAACALAPALAAFHGIGLFASLTASDWLLAAAGLAAGAMLADGLTGLVHWACDTWGDERTPWLGGGLIRAFREHHLDPRAMLEHDWIEVNREPWLAAAAALGLLSLPAAGRALEGHTTLHAFLWSFIVYGAAANQLHLWAHTERAPALVRWLQRCRIILSPDAHAAHHRAPNTRAYCISTGWLNPVLDASGFWRGLERLVTWTTGLEARDGAGGEALE
jgi:ubiquitin-conjugating enzyme E2 variant